ncbi:unnamed protein product [Protopolystoma xenopodis]|uniref:Uncharacterized protein n=1 Tax=Protopolystoma xenopodis TaxID=117903 RepID=A0A448XN98_9PLAT|nr:unnamed protein product [Protopolystoma xenopodis]
MESLNRLSLTCLASDLREIWQVALEVSAVYRHRLILGHWLASKATGFHWCQQQIHQHRQQTEMWRPNSFLPKPKPQHSSAINSFPPGSVDCTNQQEPQMPTESQFGCYLKPNPESTCPLNQQTSSDSLRSDSHLSREPVFFNRTYED